jgi:hypothetical protein
MLILAKARRGGQAQSFNSLAAYFLWGGAKNKFLGGLAALRAIHLFKIFILAKTRLRKAYLQQAVRVQRMFPRRSAKTKN